MRNPAPHDAYYHPMPNHDYQRQEISTEEILRDLEERSVKKKRGTGGSGVTWDKPSY